jgi:hypothetical protein
MSQETTTAPPLFVLPLLYGSLVLIIAIVMATTASAPYFLINPNQTVNFPLRIKVYMDQYEQDKVNFSPENHWQLACMLLEYNLDQPSVPAGGPILDSQGRLIGINSAPMQLNLFMPAVEHLVKFVVKSNDAILKAKGVGNCGLNDLVTWADVERRLRAENVRCYIVAMPGDVRGFKKSWTWSVQTYAPRSLKDRLPDEAPYATYFINRNHKAALEERQSLDFFQNDASNLEKLRATGVKTPTNTLVDTQREPLTSKDRELLAEGKICAHCAAPMDENVKFNPAAKEAGPYSSLKYPKSKRRFCSLTCRELHGEGQQKK